LELVGQVVGRYRILSLLGRGGSAEVYKAFDPDVKREVALKLLLQEASHDVDWVRRFRQEIELLGRLDNPHILPIYAAGQYEGRPYLVMKYMDDTTTLRSQLHGQPWPLNRVVKVVSQVAEALDAAHTAGVVHRDIKPSNILVTPDLRCSVFDFGIAKPFKRGDVTTGSDHIVGTPEFMSPEQCKGEKIDHRSDVYSLGVMTYQMLSGHVPFTAETAVGILMKHLTEPLPIPPKGVALPPMVNAVLRKSMARDPNERFSSAGELAEALKSSADQRATVTLHASEIRRATAPTLKLPPWVRSLRSREARLGAAAAALAGMLVSIYVLWPTSARPTATSPLDSSADATESAAASDAPSDGARERDDGSPTAAARPASRPARPAITSAEPGRTSTPTLSARPDVADTLATLEIDSDAPARVILDGQAIGRAPGIFGSVKPGRHLLALDPGDGRLSEKTVVVTAGSTERVRFDLATAEELVPNEANTPQASTSPTVIRAPDRRQKPTPIREWTGFLTDADCGATGGTQGALHLRCAERCIRDGKQPMLYTKGRLYRLEGLERVTVVRGEPLRFRGWLEVDTIHVADAEP
jgi:serine/threonine protein kinase